MFVKSKILSYVKKNCSEQYWKWLKDKGSGEWKYATGCDEFSDDRRRWSIAEAVEYFGVPREEIEEMIAVAAPALSPGSTLDLDRLYSGGCFAALTKEFATGDFPAADPALLDAAVVIGG